MNEELQEKTLSDAIASILQQSRGLLIEEGENMVSLGNGIPGNRSGVSGIVGRVSKDTKVVSTLNLSS